MELLILFYCLIIGHIIMDYPLQGDFMSNAKNRFQTKYPDVPWLTVLCSHAMLHGASVALITGNVVLGLFETIAHGTIDYFKCAGKYTFNTDQLLHLICKVIWLSIYYLGR